jgi:hypothetical protein
MDHDEAAQERVASSLDELIGNCIFGEQAAEFAGKDWREELVALGILPTASP